MDSVHDTWLTPGGFPHSEISGSKVVCHLTGAYRRLLRLSSPPTAKASTVCAYSLDHIAQACKIKLRLNLLSIQIIELQEASFFRNFRSKKNFYLVTIFAGQVCIENTHRLEKILQYSTFHLVKELWHKKSQ